MCNKLRARILCSRRQLSLMEDAKRVQVPWKGNSVIPISFSMIIVEMMMVLMLFQVILVLGTALVFGESARNRNCAHQEHL